MEVIKLPILPILPHFPTYYPYIGNRVEKAVILVISVRKRHPDAFAFGINSFFFKEEGRGAFTSPLLYSLPVSSLTIRVKGRAGGGATVGDCGVLFSQQYTSPAHLHEGER